MTSYWPTICHLEFVLACHIGNLVCVLAYHCHLYCLTSFFIGTIKSFTLTHVTHTNIVRHKSKHHWIMEI